MLTCERMSKSAGRDQSDATDGRTHRAWVEAQFQNPLESMLAKKNTDAWLFACTSLVLVAGGFATSGIAVAGGGGSGSSEAWVVFAIGLLVAFVGGMSQLFRFGVRADRRRALAVGLREEGWRYVFGEGEYAGDTADVAMTFRRRVAEINRQIAEVATLETEASRQATSVDRLNRADAEELTCEKGVGDSAATGGSGGCSRSMDPGS
jgi:hypothetical protein